jgi:hypothetical protein
MDSVALFVPIVSVLSTFSAVVLIVYILRTSKHRERMAMIEKGYDASLLHPVSPSRNTGKYSSLKWGIASVGVGIGLILGHVVESSTGMPEPGAYFSMIFLFGGLGLVIYYMLVRQHEEA